MLETIESPGLPHARDRWRRVRRRTARCETAARGRRPPSVTAIVRSATSARDWTESDSARRASRRAAVATARAAFARASASRAAPASNAIPATAPSCCVARFATSSTTSTGMPAPRARSVRSAERWRVRRSRALLRTEAGRSRRRARWALRCSRGRRARPLRRRTPTGRRAPRSEAPGRRSQPRTGRRAARA